jgi:predicted outer membrane repeat protein
VKDDGTGDAPTIQAGIDSAAAADTVLLADGDYTGPGNRDIDLLGKAIVVRSESGDPNQCVIDCEGSSGDPHTGFTFEHNETTSTVLEGVMVSGGYAESGGAVECYYTSPTINACVFSGNTGGIVGGAIDMINSSAVITNCLFVSNQSLSAGGAIYMEGSSPTISGCTIGYNTAVNFGGGIYCHANTPVIIECSIHANSSEQGGGMYLDGDCNASITYCSFWRNEATLMGGGLRCSWAEPTLENCTFAGDSSGWGGAAVHLGTSGSPGFTNTLIAFSRNGSAVGCDGGAAPGFACCNIYGNEGGDWAGCIAVHAGVNGNMTSDPRFCNMPTANLTVEGCSPCLAANNTCSVLIGSRGEGCGCGEATEPATWGGIKARYR